MSDRNLADRVERIETRLERQQETIDAQQAIIETQRERLEALAGTLNEKPQGCISRRKALQAGGVLGLLGLGATKVGADTEVGRIGTETSPVDRLYTKELAGPLLDGADPIGSLAGQGLRLENSSLRTGDVILTERGEPDGDAFASDEGMLYISDGTDSFEQGDLVYAYRHGGSVETELVVVASAVVDVRFVTTESNEVDPLVTTVEDDLGNEQYSFETIEPAEVNESDPAHDVYVLSTVGSLDLDTLVTAENTGFVHLDQLNISGELNDGGVRSLSDPGEVNDVYGDNQAAWLEITQDHPLFDGIGSQGDVFKLHDASLGDRAWFSDYSGEALADVGENEFEFDGPAVGVDDETAQVLLASSAREGGGVTHDDFTDAENTLVANAVEYVAEQADLI